MNKDTRRYLEIFSRYLILILIALPGLKIFYDIFLPLTIYPSVWLFSLKYSPIVVGSTIFIGIKKLEIIGACVAGSAYYFLLILNLTTGKIKVGKRIGLLLSTFAAFLIINILRIYILGVMYVDNSPYFNLAHKLFWYLGSTIFVVLIWFLGTYVFKVDGIPIYSDLKFMYSKTKKKHKRK